MNRRRLFGKLGKGLACLSLSKTSLPDSQALYFEPIELKIGHSLIPSDIVPRLPIGYCNILPRKFVKSNISSLRIINENNTELNEDTSIINKESTGFGVYIYIDPSGIFERPRSDANLFV
jgi:hypothetical protein